METASTETKVNSTYEYGVNLYTRWCKENSKELISDSDSQVKQFLVEHKKGWPTGKPKTVQTVKMRFQAVRKLYETNGSEVSFLDLAKKLSTLN